MNLIPDEIEKLILEALVFPESFEVIKKEVKAPEKVIKDCIKLAIRKKWISPVLWNEAKDIFETSFIYDSDNFKGYYFQATAKGLKAIGKNFSK